MTATPTAPQSGAELLARIKPTAREEIVELCLRPDLLEAHADAVQALNEQLAEDGRSDGSNTRLATGTTSAKARKLAQAVQTVEDEIVENAVKFRMRAMPKDKWRELCDDHPPRKGNEMDFYSGYNRDAVLDAAVRVCLVDPVFDDASWAEFVGVCNPGEWLELRSSVNAVNVAVNEAPKSELASRILAKRGTALKRPAPGE